MSFDGFGFAQTNHEKAAVAVKKILAGNESLREWAQGRIHRVDFPSMESNSFQLIPPVILVGTVSDAAEPMTGMQEESSIAVGIHLIWEQQRVDPLEDDEVTAVAVIKHIHRLLSKRGNYHLMDGNSRLTDRFKGLDTLDYSSIREEGSSSMMSLFLRANYVAYLDAETKQR